MAVTGYGVDVLGLTAWVTALKGPAFKQVNNALRSEAYQIAQSLVPDVERAVRLSRAPQATAMAKTIRAKRDRVPLLSIGAVNPKFRSGFTRRGSTVTSRQRRGAIAHGVVYGTKGGHPKGGGDYYLIPRDESGGPVGRYIVNGPGFSAACDAYFVAYRKVLADAGIRLGRKAA